MWEEKRLRDVCKIKPPKRQAKDRLAETDNVSFVTMHNLGELAQDILDQSELPLNEVYGSYTYFAENDVLLAKITPCFENGKLGIAKGLTNGIGFGSSEFMVLRPENTIIPEYLFYFLSRSIVREVGANLMTGAVGHKRVPPEYIENLKILIPSLPKQERIVTILDEAFAGIDTAIANTEKAITSTREIFNSALNTIFTRRGEDWLDKKLGDCASIKYGYTESASNEAVGPKFLRITDIQESGVNWDSVPYCPISTDDLEKYKLHDGDIVFARTGATTGKSFLVKSPPNAVSASYLIRVRLKPNLYQQEFISYYFQSKLYWDVINSGLSGSTQGGFNASKLGELVIPTPKLEEQKSIVAKLDILAESRDTLIANYTQKLAHLHELKQSLLNQAFSGKLTANQTEA